MKHFVANWIGPIAFIVAILMLGAVFSNCTTAMATDAPAKEKTVIDIGPRLAEIEAKLKPAISALQATPEWKERVKAAKALQEIEKKVKTTKEWAKYSALKNEQAYLTGMKKGGKK